MHNPADAYGPESNVEMRNCVCGSTMGVEKGPVVRTSRDHGRGYYVTVSGKKKWFATKRAANRFKWRHGGHLKADRVKSRH
jgi:hypothetical protein